MEFRVMSMDDQERRVDEMIAGGLKITREAIERYKPVAVVAAYSGGDDSVVSTHFAMTHLPGCFAFNADTLVGLSPAREHIARTCERFGWPLEVESATPEGPPKKRRLGGRMVPFDPARDLIAGEWRAGATAYEEAVLNHGFPGKSRRSHSLMYVKLKERPICRMLKRLGASKGAARHVLIVAGIRHDESAVRAGYRDPVRLNQYGDVWVNPFYYRSAVDFAAYRDEFGLPANPVKPRCGISGECCCETFPNDRFGRSAYEAIDPEFGRYIEGLERQVREVFPWGYGESPPSWWKDINRGQSFLFDVDDDQERFSPMCVGCERSGRR